MTTTDPVEALARTVAVEAHAGRRKPHPHPAVTGPRFHYAGLDADHGCPTWELRWPWQNDYDDG